MKWRAIVTVKSLDDGHGNTYQGCPWCLEAVVSDRQRKCRKCGTRFKRPPKPKAQRGTPERVRLEHAHAVKMASRSATKVKRSVTLLTYWLKRERMLADRLAAGCPPAKRWVKKSTPRRAISLKKDLS